MYEDRIVLFIDILGFKDLVNNSNFEDVDFAYTEFQKMAKSINEQMNTDIFLTKGRLGLVPPKTMQRLDEREQEILYFSDCIVWSYPMKAIEGIPFFQIVSPLCGALTVTIAVLFSKGILVRGGIAIGELYQGKNKVFGKGLIKAYELEGKAMYPRIAIEKEMIQNRISEKEFRLFRDQLHYNCRGFYVHNYFQTISIALKFFSDDKLKDIAKDQLDLFTKPILHVINIGKNITHPSVKSKYEWLKFKLRSIEGLEQHYDLTQLD